MVLLSLIAAATLSQAPVPAQAQAPRREASTSASEAEQARLAFSDGLIALESGDFLRAEARFLEASRLVPDWALAYLQLGIARLGQDPEDQRGLANLEQAVALDGDNARAHFQLGLTYEHLGRLDDAVRELRSAVSKRPNLTDARLALASMLATSGSDTQAVEAYTEILSQDPGHVGALAAIAVCYERLGQVELAETALLTIARLYPAVPYHRYRLAEFYERIGAHDKADKVYSELEVIDPRQRKMRRLPNAKR